MVLQLIPFLLSVGLYALSDVVPIFPPTKLMHVVLKCMPVTCLIIMLLLHKTRSTGYSLLLQLGLVLSAVGDGCLVYKEYFLPGVGAFGLAHLVYVFAFGFSPPAWRLAGLTSVVAMACFHFIALPIAEGPFVIVFLLYTIVIGSMFWRAAALCTLPKAHWSNWTAAIGAALFICSDDLLLVNKFHFPLPAAQVIILGLYWTAQAGIAVSILSIGKRERDSRKTV